MQVIFGNHMDKTVWEQYMANVVADAGVCPGCDKTIKGKVGVRKWKVLETRMFNECFEYPYFKKYGKNSLFININYEIK